MDIKYLRDNNLIVYEYVRGSRLHGIATPDSDTDIGGVYVAPEDMIFGFESDYEKTVSDAKSDVVFYELRAYCELLGKSNPNVLESLFIPEDFIIYCDPVFKKMFLDNRDKFLSQDAFPGMFGYARSQINKARGLNKKITNPVTERKTVLDFCYTVKDQGSEPIIEFLKEHGLNQKYCGLVNIPSMPGLHGVYYDFAAHLKFEKMGKKERLDMIGRTIPELHGNPVNVQMRLGNNEFYKYGGIVNSDKNTESNTVRLSSIPAGETPICVMTYNQAGYECHCRRYNEYKKWEAERNPVRYKSNKDKNYDAKNMCECMRLVTMALELAETGQYKVVRNSDRQMLMDIRAHKYDYDEIVSMCEDIAVKFETAAPKSSLQEHVDGKFVREVLKGFRKYFYNSNLKTSLKLRFEI